MPGTLYDFAFAHIGPRGGVVGVDDE